MSIKLRTIPGMEKAINRLCVRSIKRIFLEFKKSFLLKSKKLHCLLINLSKSQIFQDYLILKSLVQFSIYVLSPLNLIKSR